MKRSTATYLFAAIFVGLFGGQAFAVEAEAPSAPTAPTAVFSFEGGYAMMNTSLLSSPTFWGSAGLGFGASSVFGIEGGYMTAKEDSDSFGSYSYRQRLSAAYIGPFVEKFWNRKRYGFSLRGGMGAWREQSEYHETDGGMETYADNYTDWYPAVALAGMAYYRLTPRINLGAGLRETVLFTQADGDVYWLTTLMPFARLSVSF